MNDMTKEDLDNNGVDEAQLENESLIEESGNEDEHIDDMLIDMKEAEKELELSNGGEPAKDKPEAEAESKSGQSEAKEENEAKEPILIPKPRFDQVLSEKKFLEDQNAYLRGVLDASRAKANEQTAAPQTKQEEQSVSVVDEIDAALQEAEARKLELAEKYDEGELTTVEWKKAEIAIDNNLRLLSQKKAEAEAEALRSEAAARANEVVNTEKYNQWINAQADKLYNEHPKAAVIDATFVGKAIWEKINNQAVANLSRHGINPNDGRPESFLALMQEKAALADSYELEQLIPFLPEGYQLPASLSVQSAPKPKTPSQQAVERGMKLDLAEKQPPSISNIGRGADQSELTESDLAKLDEDEMADLLKKAPQRIARILGQSAI